MDQLALLTPVLVLIIWTFIIFLIMAFGRVSFMNNPQDAAESKDYKDNLPAWVNRTADNYNHLFEQPTLFYAIAISIALMGHGDQTAVTCAWSFVILRVVHSLVQSTVNLVMLRFGVFALSWVALLVMTIREALVIF